MVVFPWILRQVEKIEILAGVPVLLLMIQNNRCYKLYFWTLSRAVLLCKMATSLPSAFHQDSSSNTSKTTIVIAL